MQAVFNQKWFFYFLYQAGSAKGLNKISEWSDDIINHFWYCCETASKDTTSDEEALTKMKVHIDSKQAFFKMETYNIAKSKLVAEWWIKSQSIKAGKTNRNCKLIFVVW